MLVVSSCLTFLLFTCNVLGQTETTLMDLVVPTLPPVTSAKSPEPEPEITTHQHEILHPTTEAAHELPTNLKIIKNILDLILELDDVHLEVVKEFLPVTIELAKLSVHFM